VLLAAAAVYASVLVFERHDALRKASRYNLGWTAGQAAQEVSRLQAAAGAFGLSRGEVERESVELWLDVVANRAATLLKGEAGAFVHANPEAHAIVSELAATVEAARPLVRSLEDPDSAPQLMRALQRLNPRMARLASLAHARGADLAAQDAEELGRLHWQLSDLLMGLIASSLTLAGIAAWRNRLLGRANAEVRLLADSLARSGQRLSEANRRVEDAMSALTAQNATLQARDAELRRQNALFDAALNNMSQGLGTFDAGHRLIVCNRRFAELFRLPAGAAVPGAHAAGLLELAGASGGFGRAATQAVWAEHLELAARARAATFVREDEEGRSLSVSQQPMEGGGWVATYEAVTEGRRAEARIRHLANHDALTGLPNRRRFNERLREALAAPGRGGVAVLLLDLDHFKNVNDTLGHQAGDALLRSAAARIRACTREGDLVARLGGDEFAVLMQGDAGRRERAEALAGRIASALAEPFAIDRYRASVAASIGVATAAGPGASADAMLRHADVALYRAKAAGRGTHRVFEESMAAELRAKLELEADLREALDRDQLELHYQPLFDLRRGRLSGFEALLRWRHPARGMVSPAEFIPLAEETGLIVPIGRWVLRRACAEAAAFPDDAKVAVNISPVQFAGDDLPALVRGALAESGLPADRLELEITESVLLHDSDAVVATLHRLRDLGLRVALDDFGTKYSSLSYLRSFPFDKIKIDQSFVRDMAERHDCLAIVRSVARLATQLGMTATAEGVEDGAHLEQVREAGCTEAQGYLFGRPLPAAALGHLFAPRPPALVANA
jgi:diguanylate cyclase (GGDEF)-like protein